MDTAPTCTLLSCMRSVAAAVSDCAGSIRENIQLRRAHRSALLPRALPRMRPARPLPLSLMSRCLSGQLARVLSA